MRAPHPKCFPSFPGRLAWLLLVVFLATAQQPDAQWDLLLKGGHVIDPRNNVNARMDVAIRDGKIARVAADLPAVQARRVANVNGLFVTPGLIDIHAHVYAGTGLRAYTGDLSVYPDGFSYRTGVTTLVDAGTAGWRNFADFRQRVIDRAKTRVLAFVNIVADGMSPYGENDPDSMQPAEAARVAREHADIVVGFKTAHYAGPGWFSIDRTVEAGNLVNLPVMVDFGYLVGERTLKELLEVKLRPGDIYTHMYSPYRTELLPTGELNPAMRRGRERGVLFDVGHGGGSFYYFVAVPAIEQGFFPDTISTDLHTGSMNRGMKDLSNVMSKMLNLGMPLTRVIDAVTSKAALTIKRPELGHIGEGAEADVTVLQLEKGRFGFLDSAGARLDGAERLTAEVTIQGGEVMWDLNGLVATPWKEFNYQMRPEPAKPATRTERLP
ncbi:MAG: amidohydrolase/deacetylase family metallohydrolase [Bryobacterales bacterium]|nr:amidohydrolase/deacetylase family metallohydrolase [Bryobacterales bacterium]